MDQMDVEWTVIPANWANETTCWLRIHQVLSMLVASPSDRLYGSTVQLGLGVYDCGTWWWLQYVISTYFNQFQSLDYITN